MAWCNIDENLISNLISIIGDKKVLEVCSGKGACFRAFKA